MFHLYNGTGFNTQVLESEIQNLDAEGQRRSFEGVSVQGRTDLPNIPIVPRAKGCHIPYFPSPPPFRSPSIELILDLPIASQPSHRPSASGFFFSAPSSPRCFPRRSDMTYYGPLFLMLQFTTKAIHSLLVSLGAL